MTAWFTVAEVAAMWKVSPDEVRHHIRARTLGHMAVDPDARRKTYRISSVHIAKFERSRERVAA